MVRSVMVSLVKMSGANSTAPVVYKERVLLLVSTVEVFLLK